MRVGLVLGAGGVTGDAFHRGVLRALGEKGYDARSADVVVGTSAGSMVGAFLRRPDRKLERVLREETVHGRKLGRAPDLSPYLAALRRPWQARPGVLMASLLPTGRRSTDFLVSGLRSHHGTSWPEQPLYIVAVRRHDGARVVFGRDDAPRTDVAHAVAASCAIPGFFHPVEISGEAYVDGGVHSPTNADVLNGWQLDLLLVSSPMSVDPRGLRPTLDVATRLAMHSYLRRETAPHRRRRTQVVAFEPGGELLSVMGLNPLRGARIDEIEDLSAERAQEVLNRVDLAGLRAA
jgi:NTE family protein